jgi:hypothetical protein
MTRNVGGVRRDAVRERRDIDRWSIRQEHGQLTEAIMSLERLNETFTATSRSRPSRTPDTFSSLRPDGMN